MSNRRKKLKNQKRDYRTYLLVIILILGATSVSFVLKHFKEPKVQTGHDFPRFISPTSETVWRMGEKVKAVWTPISVDNPDNVSLELIANSNNFSEQITSFVQENIDPSGAFSVFTLPKKLPAKTTYQLCFFSNGISRYVGGIGVRLFCSDQFSILPVSAEGVYGADQVLQFSSPQRGEQFERGSIMTLAWPAFEKEQGKMYYIKLVLPDGTELRELLREEVNPDDGRWAVTLPYNSEISNRYLACMYVKDQSNNDLEKEIFCSDPFSLK